jgi:hypothetical protein
MTTFVLDIVGLDRRLEPLSNDARAFRARRKISRSWSITIVCMAKAFDKAPAFTSFPRTPVHVGVVTACARGAARSCRARTRRRSRERSRLRRAAERVFFAAGYAGA